MSDEREAARDAAWEKYAHDTTFEAGDGDWLQEYDVTDLVHEHWNICWDEATAAAESAHHAQLLAVAEAVREACANQADGWWTLPVDVMTFHAPSGLANCNGTPIAETIRAIDLSLIAGVGKAGE